MYSCQLIFISKISTSVFRDISAKFKLNAITNMYSVAFIMSKKFKKQSCAFQNSLSLTTTKSSLYLKGLELNHMRHDLKRE